MSQSASEIATTVIGSGALTAAVTAFITHALSKKRREASTAKAITDAAASVVEQFDNLLQETRKSLEGRIRTLEADLEDVRAARDVLQQQVNRLNAELVESRRDREKLHDEVTKLRAEVGDRASGMTTKEEDDGD